jgi:integrase
MARTVRDARLETRAARDRLKPQPKPYWRTVIPQLLHLGYRRRKGGTPGWWVCRRYTPALGKSGSPYRVETIGLADDYADADGDHVLSFAQAQERAVERQNASQGPHGPLTVAEAMAGYVRYLKAERKTAVDAERRAETLILPELGAVNVADLTTDQIIRWRDALANKPARLRTRKGEKQKYRSAPSTGDDHADEVRRQRRATVNRTLTILKAALNRAFEHGLVPDDVAWRRVKPFREVNAARPGYLTIAEAKRLINAADRASGFRDLVQGALLTGCRYGELCAMRVCDLHRGKVAVPRSKSGKPRDVMLTDEGADFFGQLTAGRAGDEPMFRRADGSGWLKSHQARPMRDACARAKIAPIGFHQLRHTWASHTVMNGVPLLVVAANLGHRDSRMAERHYAHLAKSYIEEAIRAGAPRFGAVKPSNVARARVRGA